MPNKSKADTSSHRMPAQSQDRQPGREHEMSPKPVVVAPDYRASGRLRGKAAIITGGDSGIGRAVAVHFAREGADVAVVYLEEDNDARETRRMVEAEGRRCVLLAGDVGDRPWCHEVVERVVSEFGRLDVLVNNAAEQHPTEDFFAIDEAQLVSTFRSNIFSYFFMAQAALGHLQHQRGACVIQTASVTAYRGSPGLVDYSATKGAIVAMTRSLSGLWAKSGPDETPIRVNGVAPGPIWTPLIPATFDAETVATFGSDTPLGRPGQPAEVAPCYVFLASNDASYITGQILHPNGGEIING